MFCLSNCVPMQSALCPDVWPAASERGWRCVATQVLGAWGAQLLAMWVSWWIEGKAKM